MLSFLYIVGSKISNSLVNKGPVWWATLMKHKTIGAVKPSQIFHNRVIYILAM